MTEDTDMSAKSRKKRLYQKRLGRRRRRMEAEQHQAAAPIRISAEAEAEFVAWFEHLNGLMQQAAASTHPQLRFLVGANVAETGRIMRAAGVEETETFKVAFREVCGDEFRSKMAWPEASKT